MTTHIVIPVRDQLHYTMSIVDQLCGQEGWDLCWIYDNGSTDGTHEFLTAVEEEDSRFTSFNAKGLGIYDMWWDGFIFSKNSGADHVAILNNDIELASHTISLLSETLELNPEIGVVYPDYNATVNSSVYRHKVTKGTYRHGGMSGFCFMLRASAVDWSPLVDPRFQWWGGDDDIAFELESRGWQQVRLVGLPIAHDNEGTARHYDLGAQKGTDLAAVIKKWGR